VNQNRKIVGVCALLAVSVGAANSVFKNKRLPSSRFLIGSSVAFLILSAMSETDTGSELAKGLAMGIATTVVLGEGGGLLSYLDGRGETDTQRDTKRRASSSAATSGLQPSAPADDPAILTPTSGPTPLRSDHRPAFPGLFGWVVAGSHPEAQRLANYTH